MAMVKTPYERISYTHIQRKYMGSLFKGYKATKRSFDHGSHARDLCLNPWRSGTRELSLFFWFCKTVDSWTLVRCVSSVSDPWRRPALHVVQATPLQLFASGPS